MNKPRVAESPEEQCYAFTKAKKRCMLEHTENTMFCRTHQNYPNDYHARITNPTYFEGFTARNRSEDIQELEWALNNCTIVLEPSHLSSMPDSIILGPFYNWYCGFFNEDPWKYPNLAKAALRDAIRVHNYQLEAGNHSHTITDEMQEFLAAQKESDSSEQFLETVITILQRYRLVNRNFQEKAVESLLETGVVDSFLWNSTNKNLWIEKLEKEFLEKIKTIPEKIKVRLEKSFLGFTKFILLPKLQERKIYLKTLAKSRVTLYKEDLMAKTYHPARYLEWCLDQDEKKEFEDDFKKTIKDLQKESKELYEDFLAELGEN
jgi:hypothetical protein